MKKFSKPKINIFKIQSWITFPSIENRYFEKILSLKGIDKPDAVIFDLEDSIADTYEAKNAARNKLLEFLCVNESYRNKIFSQYVVGIRINHATSAYIQDDLDAIKKIHPHIVFLPKVELQDQLIDYQKAFEGMQLCAIIETLQGYENRDAIVGILRPHDLLGIGHEDLLSQLGIEELDTSYQLNPLTHILNSCIITAKKYGINLIDGPSRKYGTEENLIACKRECQLSFSTGFQSKVAIHPSQVPIINTIFSKEKLRKKAKLIVKQFQSLENGRFVIGTEDKEMMDTPSYTLYTNALRLLEE